MRSEFMCAGCMAALQAEHFLVAQEELTDRTAPRATVGDDPTAPNGYAPDTSAATREAPTSTVEIDGLAAVEARGLQAHV